MSPAELERILDGYDDEVLSKMEGYDKAIIGVAEGVNLAQPVVAYDVDKVLAQHMAEGMTHDEALDFFYYNQASAAVGPGTPIFIYS